MSSCLKLLDPLAFLLSSPEPLRPAKHDKGVRRQEIEPGLDAFPGVTNVDRGLWRRFGHSRSNVSDKRPWVNRRSIKREGVRNDAHRENANRSLQVVRKIRGCPQRACRGALGCKQDENLESRSIHRGFAAVEPCRSGSAHEFTLRRKPLRSTQESINIS